MRTKKRDSPQKGGAARNPRCSKCEIEQVEYARYCPGCGTPVKNLRSQWKVLLPSLVLMFVIIGLLNYLMASNPGRHLLVLGVGFAFATILIISGLALRNLANRGQ